MKFTTLVCQDLTAKRTNYCRTHFSGPAYRIKAVSFGQGIFTLIELLVVVAIIAILLTIILVPIMAIQPRQNSASHLTCKALPAFMWTRTPEKSKPRISFPSV
jgi:prepilin-type N-terminal cleavage/methylation domain-containing protein